ncbi:MAG: universal stress protein [Acidobacteriota bacterium]
MFNEYRLYSNIYQAKPITRILYTTDLSIDSQQALPYATALARAYGAKLFLCHWQQTSSIEKRAQVEDQLKDMIATSVAQNGAAGLEWESVVIAGHTLEVILKEAIKDHINLIVMNSRRRPYAATLLSSTAEVICRNASCPVFVTHTPERDWVDKNGKINLRRILIAYDFSPFSELALHYALSLAQEHKAELHIMHVLPTYPEMPWRPTPQTAFHRAEHKLQHAIPLDMKTTEKIDRVVREGQPYREILLYAEEHATDLICMGAHGAGFNDWALFGSNTDRVLRQAPCPIFIARPQQ